MSENFYTEITENFTSLEILASQVVEGFITGLHKSPFHGFSVEFAEYRPYNTGESIRHIDWKLLGKTDKLFVKRYEEETNLRCCILLDVSSSMYFPIPEKNTKNKPNKITFSIYAAAALMQLLVKQRDAVGFVSFSDTIEEQTELKSNSAHLRHLFTQLQTYLPNEKQNALHKGSNIAQTLHTLAEQIHKRSLIIIFSDMFENIEDFESLFTALQHLKYKKNEVLLFHVYDQDKEMAFDFENRPYRFVDMESSMEIKLNPSQIRTKYINAIENFHAQLKIKCEQYQIDFIEANIQDGFIPILQAYLLKRQKLW
ncbi:MAG: DUF58 domain-containing protein [Bacteroidales bacterium]